MSITTLFDSFYGDLLIVFFFRRFAEDIPGPSNSRINGSVSSDSESSKSRNPSKTTTKKLTSPAESIPTIGNGKLTPPNDAQEASKENAEKKHDDATQLTDNNPFATDEDES